MAQSFGDPNHGIAAGEFLLSPGACPDRSPNVLAMRATRSAAHRRAAAAASMGGL